MRKVVVAQDFTKPYMSYNGIILPAKPCANITQAIKTLENLLKVQGSDGNWNYDSYMHGLYNGLICAMACLRGEDPVYKGAPAQWLCELPRTNQPVSAIASSYRDEIRSCVEQALAEDQTELQQAYKVICDHMKADPYYAWSWHCNVAMTAHDAGAPHDKANEWAATFMKNAFGVDTLPMVKERTRTSAADESKKERPVIDTMGKAYAVFRRIGITGFKTPKLCSKKGKQVVKMASIKPPGKEYGSLGTIRVNTKGGELEYQMFKQVDNYKYDKVTKLTTNLDDFLKQLLKLRSLKHIHSKIKDHLES